MGATIAVSLTSDNSVCANNGSVGTCFMNNAVFGVDSGMTWNTTNSGISGDIATVGSTSTNFGINAVAAVDGGSDTTVQARLNFDLLLDIVVDGPDSTWNVDLSQSALGLFGLRGDGTASAVGTQSSGSASISQITTVVGGGNANFTPSPASRTDNPSNNGTSSGQFSGSRLDNGILSGTGSQSVAVNIDFDLTAFSNDGCSGFICSSISGGEEAAVLFGDQSAMDQAVDDYSTWGRSIGPDGYDSTWTLNVTYVPEPGTAILLGLGLAGFAAARRRA